MAKTKKLTIPSLELPEGAEELKEKVEAGLEKGKKLAGKEKVRLEADIREHPLEYVVGAFVVGLIVGRFTK